MELQKKLTILGAVQDTVSNIKDDLDAQIEEWEDLQGRVQEGETASDSFGSHKRGISASQDRQSKRIHLDVDDEAVSVMDVAVPVQEKIQENPYESGPLCCKPALSEASTGIDITGLKEERNTARHRYQEVREQIQSLKDRLANLHETRTKIQATLTMQCIISRNEYTKDAIRNDYAGKSH